MDFDELHEDASAMAAAMGFSTFGSHKPPAKKRKFNPATDAFVSGQELESIDRGGKKGKGSGGNTMPLGKVRQFGVERRNEDEIGLDVDDEEDGESFATTRIDLPAERNHVEVSGNGAMRSERREGGTTDKERLPIRRASHNGGNEDEIGLDEDEDGVMEKAQNEEENDGPAYIVTSEPAPIEAVPPLDPEAVEMQARIDALLASIEEGPPPEENPITQSHLPPPPLDLPAKPTFMDQGFGVGSQRGGRGRQGRGAFSDTASVASSRQSHGEKNPRWFEGYYDPTFNENPWRVLEVEKGMESVGTWLGLKDRPGLSHE
ncbi:uncharacterized protein LY89DRAFT_686080 [Mollisia scopiformis]|uniref:Uncharacterized protein n=1 Tax=Mollisia scopiformis TaxID=149040 RepID=A0A194X551_MOLSC|nr:uncharacterized protein LY89DRAFT_686080 [Mollisia scopiformis]KUJ15310.1 hypothetical protein LY89DRAFT_686080 [Mollisia scopiformis]